MKEKLYLHGAYDVIGDELLVSRRNFLNLSGVVEDIKFSGGNVQTKNFSTYRITHFWDVSSVGIVLVVNPVLALQG